MTSITAVIMLKLVMMLERDSCHFTNIYLKATDDNRKALLNVNKVQCCFGKKGMITFVIRISVSLFVILMKRHVADI